MYMQEWGVNIKLLITPGLITPKSCLYGPVLRKIFSQVALRIYEIHENLYYYAQHHHITYEPDIQKNLHSYRQHR